MGLIDKFKNMFTEEVEEDEKDEKEVEEVETKKEKIKTTIEKPVVKIEEEKPKQHVTPTRTRKIYDDVDDEIIVKKYEPKDPIIKKEEVIEKKHEEPVVKKREEKFVFPVYFDESDFEKIERPKPIKKETIPVEPKKNDIKKEKAKNEVYGSKIEQPEKHIFKPTPIISPIYGVLNKNYNQENITTKKVTHSEYRSSAKPLTIDDVRKKAYGMSDNQDEVITKSSIFNDTEENEEKNENILNDLVENSEFNSIDDFLNSSSNNYKSKHHESKNKKNNYDDDEINNLESKINSMNNDARSKKLDSILNQDNDNLLEDYLLNNEKNNLDENIDEDLTQSDLFNLIDSMYEKGDDN